MGIQLNGITGDAIIPGDVGIGGTLTYEDVTNVDSVGIITARTGVIVGSGVTLNATGVIATGVVTATSFVGSGANLTSLPVPTTITVADESTDTTCNPLFVTTTSGNLAPKTGTNLTFNSASGNLRSGSLFVGTGTNESKTQDGLILERNSGDGEVHITAGRSGGNYGGMSFFVAGSNGVTKRHTMIYDGSFRWYDNNTNEIVRIASDGDLLIGTSSNSSSNGIGLKLNMNATNPTFNCVINQATGNHSFYHLYNTNGTHNAYRFYVQVNGGVANHSGNNVNLSDERMKKNITNMGSVYDTFKKFTFKDFNYIDDEASESKKHGLIAQDVETIDSDLITNDFKIAPDSEGNDVYRKALKEEQFMMIGMKALQEAIAKIEILEAKVAALEGS